MSKAKLVYICHPYANDPELNRARVARICRQLVSERPDCVPIAPHLVFSFLDERTNCTREQAMKLCISLLSRCDEILVPITHDFKVTDGMREEILWARGHIDIDYWPCHCAGEPLCPGAPCVKNEKYDLLEARLALAKTVTKCFPYHKLEERLSTAEATMAITSSYAEGDIDFHTMTYLHSLYPTNDGKKDMLLGGVLSWLLGRIDQWCARRKRRKLGMES